jgi:UDPglucose--hexose-1-phosphate uridylyltransferase
MRGATTSGDHSTSGGELRRNPVSGKLTIVAPGRAARPSDLHAAAAAGASGPCLFCAGNERLTPPEIDAVRPDGGTPDTPGWRIRVVPNKYPALAGRHEVIVHSPDHEAELEDLGDEGLLEVLEVWRRRIAAQLDAGAAAATLIVNRGPGAGASLAHPHAQLFGTPVVPPLLLDELLEFERFRNRYGGCVLCAEIDGAGDRLVHAGDVAAWVPAATRFPGELWLAGALRRALVAVEAATGGAPLNLWLHTAPAELRGAYHWHMELAPRLSSIAGLELGADIALVTVDPEAAAEALRAAWPQG